jgi:hypothetical protein
MSAQERELRKNYIGILCEDTRRAADPGVTEIRPPPEGLPSQSDRHRVEAPGRREMISRGCLTS